jgi:hypothetical protein
MIKTLALLLGALALAALLATPLRADFKAESPQVVCQFLKTHGLATRGWKQDYDIYSCSSPYKELGSGSPLRNNLAFYVDGGIRQATSLSLVLNVNSRREAASAHAELLKAAEALCSAALGKALPESIRTGITNGKQSSVTLERASIRLVRIDWPTGKGYELKFFIE